MLTHLQINDFTLVDQLELDLAPGLTVLTGETGAGKSILLDALGLALGDRADADKVRAGVDRAEVSATFDVCDMTQAKHWLAEHDLGDDECILRRVVTAEGRSRAYVNGKPVTLAQIKQLGEMLIDIHSQHEHQSLLKPQTHRDLLDAFGKSDGLAKQVTLAYQDWKQKQDQLREAQNNNEELNARFQLLSYQVEELNQLSVQVDEVAVLEQKQAQLANKEETLQTCQQVLEMCHDGDAGIEILLHRAGRLLSDLPGAGERLKSVTDMLSGALIQVEEARQELSNELDGVDSDDDDLHQIERRLSAIYDVARKHRIKPEEVYDFHQSLLQELAGVSSGDELTAQLEQQVQLAEEVYGSLAEQLSDKRRKAATTLTKKVNQQLKSLAMTHAKFEISLVAQSLPTRSGAEQIEFLITTVPGQPAKPLVKVASGGELSRVSLAIQVVTAASSITPTLVFDEVDVGIGGTTGDVVGALLRELGQSTQVLCVTHLAQVASKADQHLKVEKTVSKKAVSTTLFALQGEAKVDEIARMMGGKQGSEQSLAHAREMLTV